MKINTRGFTLIELLVVIAIIALLAAVGMASYRSANQRARDSRRQADLEQVRAALEMYRTDAGGYPDASSWADMVAILQDDTTDPFFDYLPQAPSEPLPGHDAYEYWTDINTYELGAVLEGTSPSGCDELSLNYCVRNP